MGPVGLNFGSATSGQGFDVTATVNQIVSNLQTVEQPWKNQLTALKNKDTALSSLGTQLSALSSDLQSLTDFNGTMAYKTGSSSNTDILMLSSASASAVAGTHTVTVQSLAQTSSAASDAIKATDTLTGSLTFKVGNGNWQTVTVGDHSTAATLAGLQAAINYADLGVIASVLTNADGTARLSLVSKTDGSAGTITIADAINNPGKPSTLADTTTPDNHIALGMATIQSGIDASLLVDGVNVTSASNTVSDAIPGVTFQLLSTGSSDPLNPQTVQVVIENDTSTIETAIGTFVKDYNSLIQSINSQEGKDSSGNSEPLYGSAVLSQLAAGLVIQHQFVLWDQKHQFADCPGYQGQRRRGWQHHSRCRCPDPGFERPLRRGCFAVSGFRKFRFDFHAGSGQPGEQWRAGRSHRPRA